ncbi:hypothetical protein Naga_100411g5 [Nannochloropsis gaditana]|uniref:Uncharacterized protein n=1 Tax=Nannochloropsis gaditana TaxID=72520 RepID=W7TTU8_9STRA|nr:hypothetical protein Naga_100411g5 [Nannochloropsis gaditana]
MGAGGGIVLSAVATELLPAMSRHKHSWQNTLATLVGFFTGVVMMVSVAHFWKASAWHGRA